MVLDPFSALSLASSIVQFVDFSSKLFSASFKIGSSATGVSRETEQIIAQAMDLQKNMLAVVGICPPRHRDWHI